MDMSMSMLNLLCLVGACVASNRVLPGLRSTSRVDQDNSITPTRTRNYFQAHDWVKISEAPPTEVTQTLGKTLELECEAIGSPTPTIQWLRGNAPITDAEDFENNEISEGSTSVLARVRSRLLVDNVIPTERSIYTCLARAGGETSLASSTVYSSAPGGIMKQRNLTELILLNNNILNGPQRARIVLFFTVVMETIGSSVILPCHTAGRPRPEVFWLDNNENLISNHDPRIKTLPTGELLISNLRWADMGGYTCVARNPLAKDSITTFIYPVLNDDN